MPKAKNESSRLNVVDEVGEDVVIVNNFDGTASVWPYKEVSSVFKRISENTPNEALSVLIEMFSNSPERVFQLRAKDIKMLEKFKTIDAGGGYFFGTLRDGDQKFAHQIALKEVTSSELNDSLSNPLALSISAGMRRLENKLEQIESAIKEIDVSVATIEKLLRRKFGADVVSAVHIVSNIYESFSRNGQIDEIDCNRLIAVECSLISHYVQITEEICAVKNNLQLRENFGADVATLLVGEHRICEEEWVRTVHIETLLRKACLEYLRLFQHMKLQSSSFDPHQIEDARNNLFALNCRVDNAMVSINRSFLKYRVPKCPNEFFSIIIGGLPRVNRHSEEYHKLSELKECMTESTKNHIKNIETDIPKLKLVAA